MGFNIVVKCRIVTCFILCGIIQIADSYKITINQLRGFWYGIGIIPQASITFHDIKCYRIEVSKQGGDDQNFKEVTTITSHGFRRTYKKYGNIINSRIHILNRFSSKISIFTAKLLRNGEAIVLTEQSSSPFHRLICRNVTCSQQTISAFENLAQQQNATAGYFSQNECPTKVLPVPRLG